MPYTCQTCGKRKVKCDKAKPKCSSCHKSKLDCVYQAPQPRRRKRKLSDVLNQRLEQYERILTQHNLLPQDTTSSTLNDVAPAPQGPVSETLRMGKSVVDNGKSMYIDSDLWRNLDNNQDQGVSDDDKESEEETGGEVGAGEISTACDALDDVVDDPLAGAFMSHNQSWRQNLWQYHPNHAEAVILWQTYVENVEPLCKILHIPTTFHMLDRALQSPDAVANADECLLFAVYHFAVFSLTEDDCTRTLGQPRHQLLQRFHFATRQALVNVSFLRTTGMRIYKLSSFF